MKSINKPLKLQVNNSAHSVPRTNEQSCWQRQESTLSLTHAAPQVLAQFPTCSTATLDMALSPHDTYVITSTISQLTRCNIC